MKNSRIKPIVKVKTKKGLKGDTGPMGPPGPAGLTGAPGTVGARIKFIWAFVLIFALVHETINFDRVVLEHRRTELQEIIVRATLLQVLKGGVSVPMQKL